MNDNASSGLPKTLPAKFELFANSKANSPCAQKIVGHIGWYMGATYYWPKDGSCWKLVEPNPNNKERRESFHRGPAINPARHRKAGIAALVGMTVMLETAE